MQEKEQRKYARFLAKEGASLGDKLLDKDGIIPSAHSADSGEDPCIPP
jgi:hypothetical protein